MYNSPARPGPQAPRSDHQVGDLGAGPDEIRRVRGSARTNRRPFAVDRGVYAHVVEWARTGPERVAVSEAGRHLSYAALAAAASELARDLTQLGVGQGSVVAVLGVRRLETVSVFLAIESLNAVYLPIGPDWPPRRVERVLQDSGASALVDPRAQDSGEADNGLGGKLPADGPQVVPVRQPDVGAVVRQARSAQPSDRRYLIYTSGSTGAPKGVIVHHLGLMNHLWGKIEDLGICEADSVALTAPLTFDISVWQMLTALVVGGRVVIVDENDSTFARRLLAALAAGGVTVAQFVPSNLSWIAEEVRRRPAIARKLRLSRLLSIGEKLQMRLAEELLELLPGVRVINSYGPTECSDGVSHHWVTSDDLRRANLPIGRPLGNCTLYVLRQSNGAWHAADPGQRGELFIGGAGVGGGYLHQEGLVRESFFADVFDPDSPTGRLFRTRDEVFLAADGSIEFLQRVDRQVKVSGVRIELGEIETLLHNHPGVASCVVTAEERSDVSRSTGIARELFVYFVPAGEVQARDLEGHLREHLPAAMVPRRWVPLTALPLTPHGKIDYPALSEGREDGSVG
ncbi:amino acid adenylation domain-containing protein [Micromonospora sp. NPDC049662]|uniref:amino acid adenylation domain-containing protein n=1 Tax=Micromonospora sp. NPDC049662 TaxID=3155397 RepID=UPI00341508DF